MTTASRPKPIGEIRRVLPAAARRSAWLLAIGALTLLCLWLDHQYSLGRGPARQLNPWLAVWVSLGLVGIVLLLWIVAFLREKSARKKFASPLFNRQTSPGGRRARFDLARRGDGESW